jgi:O-antigen/teichoic acid export membrane protein
VNSKPAREGYVRKVAIASLFNSGASALATALLLPFVIRSIGMQSYGIWAVLGIFIGIAAALDFGIWKSLVYLIPRKQHSLGQLLLTSMALCMLGGMLFSAAFVLLLAAHVPLFGAAIAAQGNLSWWLAAGGCAILLAGLLTNLARGVLEATYRGHWVNIGYGLLTVAQYGVAALIARWTHDPRALIVGSVLVYTVNLVAHVACLSLGSISWERPRRSAAAAILQYGAASFGADAPVILLGPAISYLFVLMVNDSGDYGVFDISLRVATLAGTALALLSASFFAIVAAADDGARQEVRRMIARHLRLTLGLAVIGWMAFWALGKPILAFVFSERSAEIYRASSIMLVGTAAVAALEPVTRMLMGIGRLRPLFFTRLSMLGIALLFLVLLAHSEPLDRFAISYAAGFLASAAGLWLLDRTERWGRTI